MQTSKLDLASSNTCNVTIPLIIGSSEQQIKPCDPSQGGSSQSSKTSGTGCSPAAHAHDLYSGPPTRPLKSLNTKQALKSKPSLSTDPRREKPEAEETHRGAKRVRRTWVKPLIQRCRSLVYETGYRFYRSMLYQPKLCCLLYCIYGLFRMVHE